MEIHVNDNEQITTVVYEAPMLVEVGEFSADTLGPPGNFADFVGSLA